MIVYTNVENHLFLSLLIRHCGELGVSDLRDALALSSNP